jgi:isopenicillin N synthase-like dioxygenase
MEQYFAQPTETKMLDVHPELHYQVGATPENVEKPRCLRDQALLEAAKALPPPHRPTIPTTADVKWRYFWRVGERPKETRFTELNAEPVIPSAFTDCWQQVMDAWGNKMMAAVGTVAEMAAIGFGLDKDAFNQRMYLGPHLLAPTGVDVAKYGNVGAVFAGYHYDLNFLTIHGKSRYPGLFIWLREGKRIPVRIPDGCLLIQAGKQMEWLTGGYVKAGYHEVICTEETMKAASIAREEGRPVWRVSSTVFSQIASDEVLRPLGHFATRHEEEEEEEEGGEGGRGGKEEYPEITAGNYVQQELQYINLAPSSCVQ